MPERTAGPTGAAAPVRRSWWAQLAPGAKASLLISAIALPFILCGGGLVLGALADDLTEEPAVPVASPESPSATPPEVEPTESPSPTPTTASPSPTVEVQTVIETKEIPFEEETVDDPSLLEGTREVRVEGEAGVKRLTYEVTLADGVETGRELVAEEVVKVPVNRVIAIGTKPAPAPAPAPEPESDCDPNYSGACVPIASDVDCAGGTGDDPAYVNGPVQVVGEDIYGLDRDGDGVGCEIHG